MTDRAAMRCGAVVAPDGIASSERVAWRVPKSDDDRLAARCARVGPVVLAPAPLLGNDSPADTLLVVSWNTHAGVSDFGALVDSISARRGGTLPPAVFLLQEVFRDEQKRGAARTRRLDVRDLADAFGLALYYVPSMPDEGVGTDRGNAILSNLPLSALEAIELPLVRRKSPSRRVVVAAAVRGRRRDGTCWQLRVASAHLDATHARALVEALGVAPATVLGGGFDTFGRRHEAAVPTLHASFPSGTLAPPAEATHVVRAGSVVRRDQLDYLFFRLPNQAVAPPYARFRRSPEDSEEAFFGSDHSPLAGAVPLGDLGAPCQ